MKKNEIEKYCRCLQMDSKKIYRNQKINLILGLISAIAIYLYSDSITFSLAAFMIFIFLYFNETIILKKKVNNSYKQILENFANFISYVLVLLENNFNIYQTLDICKEYCDSTLREELTDLLKNIDIDKTLTPFYTFAKKIDSTIVTQIMVMLHQLQTNGYEIKYLQRFPPLIEKIRQDGKQYTINKRKESFSIYTVVPIIGLLAVIFIFTFSILAIFMGGTYVK